METDTTRRRPATMTPDNTPAARLVRRAYVVRRRAAEEQTTGVVSRWGATRMAAWDGGETPSGRNCPNAWLAIAAACLAAEVDPVLLVDAAFTPPVQPFLNPNQLASESLLRRARQMGLDAAATITAALAQQRAVLRGEVRSATDRGVDKARAVILALTEPSIPLSGLFRYCYAARAGDEDLAGHFADGAVAQYAYRARAYDAAWGDLITDDLRQLAQTFFD